MSFKKHGEFPFDDVSYFIKNLTSFCFLFFRIVLLFSSYFESVSYNFGRFSNYFHRILRFFPVFFTLAKLHTFYCEMEILKQRLAKNMNLMKYSICLNSAPFFSSFRSH